MKHSCFCVLLAFILIFSSVSAEPKSANTITADTGFRVETDGFSFQNYGASVCEGGSGYSIFFPGASGDCYKVQNLTANEMVRMYGDQVCKSIDSNGKCTLTKVAESWMNEINKIVTNGHCEGMAVLSSLFYSGIMDPSDFGAKSTHNLTLKNNTKLQREIAYWFTTQMFMEDHLIQNDPKTQVAYLEKIFKQNPDQPVPLGIFTRNMSGGHAVTAYAVVDGGSGIKYIMVYDNNYPDEQKYITVDTKRNTWEYESGASNPWSIMSSDYSGSGRKNPFQIGPIEPRLGQFECAFCTTKPSRKPRVTPTQSPSNPSYPSYPDDSSGYDSIWDILSPWLNPDGGDSPYVSPDVSPSTPSYPDDSSGYDSIWDILAPWMLPSNPSSPSVTPDESPYEPSYPDDSSGYDSIWDILSPWLNPGAPSQDGGKPVVIPTASPDSKPLVRPTAFPESASDNETYTISVNSAVNIYMETDNDERAGYDWETGDIYDEIEGVSITRSMGRSSARVPEGTRYYMWLNSLEKEGWDKIDATITAPGRFIKLTNIPEGLEFPTFVYTPDISVKKNGDHYEVFEINADPNELPGIEFTITDDYGEYAFKFDTELVTGKKKASSPDASVNFLVMHNYETGEIGIWLSASDDEDAKYFKNCEFDIDGEFTLWENGKETTLTTGKKPIVSDIDGLFFINYRQWQDSGKLTITGDLDGDNKYETNRTLQGGQLTMAR